MNTDIHTTNHSGYNDSTTYKKRCNRCGKICELLTNGLCARCDDVCFGKR